MQAGVKMAKANSEIETVVFQALSHPMRRTIIQVLEANPNGASYTELLNELGIPTGKINYHIEQLEGLIEKNQDHRYVLTSLGKKALRQLKQLKVDVTDEDIRYLKIAEKSQKASLEPTIKSFIIIGIAASLVGMAILGMLTYTAVTEEGTPLLIYALLPILMAIDVAVVATLIRALKKVPNWLREIERRFTTT
jgi:predicted transcriptional regulator